MKQEAPPGAKVSRVEAGLLVALFAVLAGVVVLADAARWVWDRLKAGAKWVWKKFFTKSSESS